MIGEGGGRSRVTGEYFGRGDGNVSPKDTPEAFGGSWSATSGGISLLEMGTGFLSSLTILAVILTRLGFLARSLVGYNVAK